MPANTCISHELYRDPKNKNGQENTFLAVLSDPAGIRTQDPYIKSVMLYQLSYEIIIQYLKFALPSPFPK